MQRLFDRIAWQNLPIQAKTGMMFFLQVSLLGLMAIAALFAFTRVRSQVEEATSTTIDISSTVLDIQLQVEELQRTQTRLIEEVNRPGFNPETSTIDNNYTETVTNLLEEDIPHLEALLNVLPENENQNIFNAELRSFEGHVINSQISFDRTFELITLLTKEDTGAIDRLEDVGDELETIILERDDALLIPQLNLLRSIASDIIDGETQELESFQRAGQNLTSLYVGRTSPEVFDQNFAPTVEVYLADGEIVSNLMGDLELTNRAALVSLGFLRTSAIRIKTISTTASLSQVENIDRVQRSATLTLMIGFVIVLIIGGFLTYLIGRSFTKQILTLLRTAQAFESGNLSVRAQISGDDEFNQLALSFNAMAVQITGLVSGLEQRVAERTRDLSITAEIGQAVVALNNPLELMNQVVELVRHRFDFYHAQVFLVDEEGGNAVLFASTGTAGRELLARNHSLPVGSQSVIGQVTSAGDSVIALDTDTSGVHKRNELLPDTRSEMALPMRIGSRIIGALDVQSVAPNAFDSSSIAVFQTMADQLAVALENARLYTRLETANEALLGLQQRVTGDAWRSYRDERSDNTSLAYELVEDEVVPRDDVLPKAMNEAMVKDTMETSDKSQEVNLAFPIRVRGEVIGAFGFGGDDIQELTEDELALVEAVIDRVGLALENLRLVEQTIRRAEYEQIVNEITAKIVGSTDVSHILQTTAQELGRVLQSPQTSVQIRKQQDTDNEL